ncbi:MAG: hypothetical protein M1840_000779 [Geoglossum simile]|nr:MAG: hypothetical protein M1840_000779 [Geoglossum simile]
MASASAAAAAVFAEVVLGGLSEQERRAATNRITSRLRDDGPCDSALSTAHLVAQMVQRYPDAAVSKTLEDSLLYTLDCDYARVTDKLTAFHQVAELIIDCPHVAHGFLGRISQQLLLALQGLALPKDGDSPGFAVPTLDFLERFCRNCQTSSACAPKSGNGELATAKKYLEFLKVLFWSSKKGTPVVDTSLLCTLLALSGATNTAVARAAGEAVRCFLAGCILPNVFELLPEAIWCRILNLTSESKNVDYVDSAYSLWAYWIPLPEPLRPSQSLLTEYSYWDLLRLGLHTGYSGRRKQCLYILVNSPAYIGDSITTTQPAVDRSKKYIPQVLWAKYSTIFKIIVLDRAVNQIVGTLSEFRSLLQCGSGFPGGFITVLFSSSLLPAMSDGVRKIVGNFVLGLSIEELAFLENEQSFIAGSLLPYAVNGSLFTSSIQWQKPLTHCEHGQKVSGFLKRLIQGFPAESKAAHSRAILEFLHAKRDLIFAPARAYVLQGLRDGLGGEACLGAHDATLIGKISALTAYSELFRDLYKSLCLDIYLCVKPSLIVDYMGFLDQVASSLAGCEHIVSEKQIQAFAVYLDTDVVLRYLDDVGPPDADWKMLSSSVLRDAFLIHVQACWRPKHIPSWISTNRTAELISVLLRYDIKLTKKLAGRDLPGALLNSVLGCGNTRVLELEKSGRLPNIVEYFCYIYSDGLHSLESNVRDVVSEICLKLATQEPSVPMRGKSTDGREIPERTALNWLGVCAAYAKLRQPDTPIQRLTIGWIFKYFRNMQDLDLDRNQNTNKERLQVRDATLAAGLSLLQSILKVQHAKGVPLSVQSLSESLLDITSSRYMQEKALRSLLHCVKYIVDIDYSSPLSAPTAEALIEHLVITTDFLGYPKDVLIDLPSVVLHARIISLCMENESLSALISRTLRSLVEMAAGKPYLFSAISKSIRRCFWRCPEKFSSWEPLQDVVFDIINKPPIPHLEFQLEVATAMILETENPSLNYERYYGEKYGLGFASIFDLLSRLGSTGNQSIFGRRILDRILDPWTSQKEFVPIVSKWKRTSQLQAILILVKQQFMEAKVCDEYLDKFLRILSKEPNPRFRFLLEWIASLIVLQAPEIRSKLLRDLSTTDHSNPKYLASLLRVALMTAPHVQESSREEFHLELTTLVVPMATSPKTLLRHEAQVEDDISRDYFSITDDPIMQQLHAYTASTKENPNAMRVGHFDPVENYNLGTIFQGEYLNMNPPDVRLLSADDFIAVGLDDIGTEIPNPRVALGSKTDLDVTAGKSSQSSKQPQRHSEVPLQTKAVTWQPQELLLGSTLHGHTQGRPHEVIIIASLIDNYFNIGGLSRVSEIFGAKSLHINSLAVLKTQQFTSVSVSSDVWLPIEELAVPDIPQFLRERRLEGYTIVGIEQTNRSVALGQADWRFPRKTVLLLGSEREGIPALLLSEMDVCVEIPQKGQTRSMNVQTAAAVVLYEYTRQHS